LSNLLASSTQMEQRKSFDECICSTIDRYISMVVDETGHTEKSYTSTEVYVAIAASGSW
jgi:hypothetical protein